MNAEKLRNARCTKPTYWLWQECGKHSMKTIWKLSKLSFHDRTSAAADSLLLFPTPDGQSEFFLYKRICRQQRAVAEERKTENFSDFKSMYYLYYSSSMITFYKEGWIEFYRYQKHPLGLVGAFFIFFASLWKMSGITNVCVLNFAVMYLSKLRGESTSIYPLLIINNV